MRADLTPELVATATNEPSHIVKVLPIDEGWCVAVGRGHYAQPLSKQDAILRASAIARSMHASEIGVYDAEGLIETIAC